MSVLEAMAAGCAVVATDVGGTQDVVVSGRTGLLVPPEDSAALAAAIIELLLDAQRRQAFGRNGRQHVERYFSAAVMGDRYRTLFRETRKTTRP
jgi:glycosyltransferase involved in cell wall biosynthesis